MTRPIRSPLFRFEDRGLTSVGLIGGDDLEQVLAQHPQRFRVMVLGLGAVGVDVVGEAGRPPR